ncbi:flagellin [Geodermatophilus sp. SYSU D00742]
MGLGIATNTAAVNAFRHLSTSYAAVRTSLERLSSGHRINRAADDAAGLAISVGLTSQVRGAVVGLRNAQDAVDVVQTADGALSATTALLQRMRDLAVRAANTGAANPEVTAALQAEISRLKAEVTRIAGGTTLHGIPLLDGSYHGTFQVGAHAGDTIDVAIGAALDTAGLWLAGVDVTVLGDQAVTTSAARGRGDEPRAGLLVFVGATTRPDGISRLSGTVTLGAGTVDLDALSDSDGDGVVSNREAVDQLNAAARAAGITHRPDPFVDDGDDLVFRGPVPTEDATAADLAEANPASSGGPAPDVRVVAARTADPATAGLIAFPGSTAADIPALRGRISANGETLDLSAVTYTDTDGDGTVDGDEALAQLNAAALAAGITTRGDAFAETRLTTLGEDAYEDHGIAVVFRGPVPADDATAADLVAATPVHTQDPPPLDAIDAALTAVSTQRASLGALQNRLEHVVDHLRVSIENTAASLSRIRDTDTSAEAARLTRAQILTGSGVAMLAQANQAPRNVLTLLG